MVNLLNIFNTIADSNLAYYILVIILLIVVVSMIYLIYSQNKEMNEAKRIREEQEREAEKESQDMVSSIAKEIKEEKEEEKFSRTMNTPIHDSVLEMIQKDEEIKNSINIITEEPETEPNPEPVTEPVKEEVKEKERVKTMVDIDLPKMKKQEIIDATLTNLPKVSLLEETMTALPPLMDYDGNADDLLQITQQLENAPKERTIKLTPYEEEQEQTAIISYDELIKSNDGIVYNDVSSNDGVEVKQVDLDKTTNINVEEHKIPKETYAHEELFLSRLKSLQSKIN